MRVRACVCVCVRVCACVCVLNARFEAKTKKFGLTNEVLKLRH